MICVITNVSVYTLYFQITILSYNKVLYFIVSHKKMYNEALYLLVETGSTYGQMIRVITNVSDKRKMYTKVLYFLIKIFTNL